MCISQGCPDPNEDHGDPRNITLNDLLSAAECGDVSIEDVVGHIQSAVAQIDVPAADELIEDEVEVFQKRLDVGPNPQRFVLGVAYPANTVDGHGEFMKAEELERVAHEYMQKSRVVNFFHADGTEGHGTIVESFIHRGPDWITQDISGKEQIIKSGDWVLGAICDDLGFEQVLSERADGWSMEGFAKKRTTVAPKGNR